MTAAAAFLGGLAWLALRTLAPAAVYRLPAFLRPLWRVLLPTGLVLAAGWGWPPAGLALAMALAGAAFWIRRSPAVLRREIAALAEACSRALAAAGLATEFPQVAACVLRQRDSRPPMTGAEAAAVAGRCANVDELAAQVALRERGFAAYAAYVQRFGRTGEVADPAAAAHGSRFPDFDTGAGRSGPGSEVK